jgi:site-specific recombinase XerD
MKRIRLIDDDERAVVGLWRGHLCRGTIEGYIYCVRRFRSYCKRQNIVEAEQLTATRLERFLRADDLTRSRGRRSTQNRRLLANKALHAWACALKTMGRPIPLWRESHEKRPPVPLQEYCRYRRSHNGVSERTLARDVETASAFLKQLRLRKKPIKLAALADVDALVRTFSARLSKRTVADNCSSLRAFLRFLQTTGRLPVDLASGVIAPRYRIDERPPRTLPWKAVQIILRSISRSEAPGKRDFAIPSALTRSYPPLLTKTDPPVLN